MKDMSLLLVAALSLFLFPSLSTDRSSGYEIGETVEDFNLPNVDESRISLKEYMGKNGTIVIFTCNTCPFAQMYEDRIKALHTRFAGLGIPVLAINPNDPQQSKGDSFEQMKVRAEQKAFPFAYLLDENQEVYPRFGATNTPQVFLLDGDLKLRYSGAIDDNPQDASAVRTRYVENAIEAIMSEENPEPARTKAIGCGIKARKREG